MLFRLYKYEERNDDALNILIKKNKKKDPEVSQFMHNSNIEMSSGVVKRNIGKLLDIDADGVVTYFHGRYARF